ncbi:MAG: tRNA (guanosine(37)-N1)-methyltransferase TrmD [Proteobacteria bacterium]|nr:tRNA (guanosine(37)-N1)-methyltransferase TrmD [Pseudomonadota bacterium]
MSVPTFHFVTLFPETIQIWMTTSILGRAHKAGLFDFKIYQLRDYSTAKHLNVDDVAYGGGGGMVLQLEPLVRAVESIQENLKAKTSQVIYFSPAGQRLNHTLVHKWATSNTITDFIFICGHYEGVDQRFIDHWVDSEISLGDFVITGGELPALATADAMIRQLEGTLGSKTTAQTESFSLTSGDSLLLEYPHYTRPSEYRGIKVPEILLSGNHSAIEAWRLEEATKRTMEKRPDLLKPSSTETT